MLDRYLISVDGIDGSGKSRFSARLHEQCVAQGVRSLLISVDDFRRPVDWSHVGDREAETYYTEYFDFASVEKCLHAFVSGEDSFSRPSFDSTSERTTGHSRVNCADYDVLILEGIFTLRIPTALRGFRIYLCTDYPEAKRRIVDRDMAKGRPLPEVERRIRERYFPCQERYHREHQPEDGANVVIENQDYDHPRTRRASLDGLPPFLQQIVAALLP